MSVSTLHPYAPNVDSCLPCHRERSLAEHMGRQPRTVLVGLVILGEEVLDPEVQPVRGELFVHLMGNVPFLFEDRPKRGQVILPEPCLAFEAIENRN